MKAVVNRIIPFSSVDGPGNRTAIFLQGCNINCKYCHNPETRKMCVQCGTCVKNCPAGALSMGTDQKVKFDPAKCVQCDTCIHVCPNDSSPRTCEMTPEEVYERVKKQIPFIRGISVSGGECMLQPEFLTELFRLAKKDGLGTLIDSNGMVPFENYPELMEVADGVMLDIKAWTPEDHKRVTGQDNAAVLKNLHWLAENGKLPEVRTVVVPELFDCEATVRNVCQVLVDNGCFGTRYKIICYRPMGVREAYKTLTPPTQEQLRQLAEIAMGYGLTDVVII